MPQSCCVVKCTHYRTSSPCRLFRFPANENRALAWEKNIGRENWERKTWDRICECHFEEQEFEQHRRDGRKKLLPTAVPSVFPTHRVMLPLRQSQDPPDPSDVTKMVVPDQLQVWQLKIEGNKVMFCLNGGDARSFEGNLLGTEKKCAPETLTQEAPSGDYSSSTGPLTARESAVLLERCQKEVVLLKQTLHSYKQRAWNMDIVLASLRRENELLRGVVHELSPGYLNSVLELQNS